MHYIANVNRLLGFTRLGQLKTSKYRKLQKSLQTLLLLSVKEMKTSLETAPRTREQTLAGAGLDLIPRTAQCPRNCQKEPPITYVQVWTKNIKLNTLM